MKFAALQVAVATDVTSPNGEKRGSEPYGASDPIGRAEAAAIDGNIVQCRTDAADVESGLALGADRRHLGGEGGIALDRRSYCIRAFRTASAIALSSRL